MNKKLRIIFFGLILLLASNVCASNIDDLKAKIEEQNKQIGEIEKEIAAIQDELDKNTKEATTLKNQIKQLELSKKKLLTDISLTQKQIESAELNIEELTLQIELKEKEINNKVATLGEIIRDIKDRESTSIVELILSRENFSDFFGDLAKMEDFQKEININLAELKSLKNNLEIEKSDKEEQKNSLEKFKSKLSDQKQLVEINKADKDKLLQETKNKESNYKNILAEKTKQREEFEKELSEYESQLQVEIDPNSLPSAGSGVLNWPFSSEKILDCKENKRFGNIYCITQYFGNTPFATANPQFYKSGMHNGIDFGVPSGTSVLSSADGVVKGTGNTDLTCRYASFGKWILIEHNNGLSTLYAHLSLIKVSVGQTVKRGQLIGYSGNTGSSTGPHLHYMVYAPNGAKIGGLPSAGCKGKVFTIPLPTATNSYLNPLSYLPI